MKRCVINVSVGGWYPKGQARLSASLHQFFTGQFVHWCNTYPPGSPTHLVLPYGFKSYAFAEAIRCGYDSILWLDSSCWAIKPMGPLFDALESAGHLFSEEGWQAGEWLNDPALDSLRVTRDEAMNMPLLGGMFMGVSLNNPRSVQWLRRFTEVCQDGHTLPGTGKNVNGNISKDPRCLGHVADQAVASVIAYQLGMKLTIPPMWRDWYREKPDPSTVITAQGM